LTPWVAWACLAVVVAGIGAAAALGGQAQLFRRVPLEKRPEVLAERAREILGEVGYSEAPVDTACGFTTDGDFLQYVRTHDRSASRWDRLPSSAIPFWYRQSPRTFERLVFFGEWFLPGVSPDDPPRMVSGESLVWLDGRGRLLELVVIPPQLDESSGTPEAPDWAVLFREAGLNTAEWTAVEPVWTPLLYADTRVAWRGALPEHPGVAMRIEAGAYRGRPVYWSLIEPWRRPNRMVAYTFSPGERAGNVLAAVIFVSLIAGGAFFARRNLRMGRGDRRGATRLAGLAFTLTLAVWVFAESHVATLYEIGLFVMAVCWATFVSGLLWLLYVALEPFVRRRWPVLLVSWSRLLSGSVRDPLVGRDVLVGCVLGTIAVSLLFLTVPAATWLGVPQGEPYIGALRVLLGSRSVLAVTSWFVLSPVFFALAVLFLLFLLRVLLRSEWLTVVLLIAILTAFDSLQSSNYLPLSVITNALLDGAALFVLVRFGLLALVVSFQFGNILQTFPITTDLSAWYAGIGLTGIVLLLGLTVYGFYTSLGGQSPFGRVSLED